MIENLLKQRELLNVQIEEEQTKEIRQTINDLQENTRVLSQRLRDAKSRKSITDAEISEQIKACYAEIERLKNLGLSEIYCVSQVQNQINENAEKIVLNKQRLSKILAENE
jgi:phage host-nuclease inhibitor protein Gam